MYVVHLKIVSVSLCYLRFSNCVYQFSFTLVLVSTNETLMLPNNCSLVGRLLEHKEEPQPIGRHMS